MSEKEMDEPVDPPDNQGGGGTGEISLDAPARSEADPPDNQGGGG